MLFIETLTFTRTVQEHLKDREYQRLQWSLLLNPDQGDMIQGLHGARKLRWGTEGKGKRGGVRIIYYVKHRTHEIWMLAIYAKNAKADLSERDRTTLQVLIEEIKR